MRSLKVIPGTPSGNYGKKISRLKLYKTPICMLFSFLLGCMFAIGITPIEKTCRVNDFDRELNVMRNSELKNPELIILILSSPENLERRNTIRQTWLKLKDKSQEYVRDSKKFKVKHYFAIGNIGLNDKEYSRLDTEQLEFNDILLLPIKDSYKNLTLKVLKSYEWLNEQFNYGLGFKYVMKCDDDSFVRLDNLIYEIQHIELLYLKSNLPNVLQISKENNPYLRINIQVNNYEIENNLSIYWGYFDGRASIKRNGKWKEQHWIACDKYIPYALGGGYVLSKSLITYIAKNIEYLRIYNSEDVSVGFWLSTVNNVIRIHDIRFDTEWTSRGCQNFNLVSHNLNKKDMHEMFTNLNSKNILCTNEHLSRNFYHYNWSALPSQCCHTEKIKQIS